MHHIIMGLKFLERFKARKEEKTYSCDICRVNFEDLQERDEHMRTLHYGEVE